MTKKWLAISLPFILLSGLISGCGGSKTGTDDTGAGTGTDTEKHDPVTLTMYNWGNATDADFQTLFVEPVKKKFPYITLEQIKRGKGTEPETLVASGTFPDFILTNDDTLNQFNKLELLADISPLIKKEKIDLSRFESAPLNRSKYNDVQVGLPFNMNWSALFYNKDIFDKFGVAYPTDRMSYDEVLGIARRLTVMDQGTQYRGFDPQSVYVLKSPLNIGILDPKTDKSTLSSDKWKESISLYKNIVSIPGNQQKGTAYADMANGFIKNRSTAMVVSNIMSSLSEAAAEGLNWDMKQMPYYKSAPDGGGPAQTAVLAVSGISKHQEEVMKVINLLTSDELQIQMTKNSPFLSSLKKQEIKDQIGSNVSYLKGKNVAVIAKQKPMEPLKSSLYDGDVRSIFDTKLKEFAEDKKDMNTMIREAEEEMNMKVASLKK